MDASAARLPDATRLGPLSLTVRAADSLARFYTDALGLDQRPRTGGEIGLGFEGEDLLRLVPDPEGREAGRHASLYHVCLAVERRADLGWWLRRLLDGGFELQGLVDHRMAEAIYLTDPEGNGIELNWDRPRSQWRPWSEWLAMGNAPLDAAGLLAENGAAGPRTAPGPGTRVGHVHLHIGDLGLGEAFYCGALGLAKTAEVPGQVVFCSAGGYHHHVAINVWRGRGVAPQPLGAYGLRTFSFVLPGAGDVAAAAERLRAAGHPVEAIPGGLLTRDPSGHGLVLKAVN